tara:strand:+ start:988 stop:1200 length:213 start_codon:yes stop_codon:yes gene_type:complete
VIDFRFEETSLIIDLNVILFLNPIKTPIDAPIRRINWLEPSIAEFPKTKTLYVKSKTRQNIGKNDWKSDI